VDRNTAAWQPCAWLSSVLTLVMHITSQTNWMPLLALATAAHPESSKGVSERHHICVQRWHQSLNAAIPWSTTHLVIPGLTKHRNKGCILPVQRLADLMLPANQYPLSVTTHDVSFCLWKFASNHVMFCQRGWNEMLCFTGNWELDCEKGERWHQAISSQTQVILTHHPLASA